MVKMLEFNVTEPPTSDGVQERARAAMAAQTKATRNILHLTVEPIQEVPAPTSEDVTVRILRPTYDDDGTLTVIEGRLVSPEDPELATELGSVIINLGKPSVAALANIVTPEA